MKVAVEELGGLQAASRRRGAARSRAEGVGAGLRARAEARRKPARLPQGQGPAQLVKLHFADDVRQEVAEHLIPDVYRQALAETQIEPVDEPDLQEVTLEEDAPLSVLGGGGGQAGHHAGRLHRRSRSQHAPKPVTDAEVDEALDAAARAARGVPQRGARRRPRRPRDRGLHADPRGHGARAPRPATASWSGSGTVLPEIDEAVIGLAAGRRAPDARALRRRPPHRGAARQGGDGAP